MSMADHKSLKFQRKSQDYREKINSVLRRSDLRDAFIDSEVLALDGYVNDNGFIQKSNTINMYFFQDPKIKKTSSSISTSYLTLTKDSFPHQI